MYTFDEVMEIRKKKLVDAKAYVEETGLCFKCKVNSVREGGIVCQECYDKTEVLLGKLRGMSGFVEL